MSEWASLPTAGMSFRLFLEPPGAGVVGGLEVAAVVDLHHVQLPGDFEQGVGFDGAGSVAIEWMRDGEDPALLLDRPGGIEDRHAGRDEFVEKVAEQLATIGPDFFPHDYREGSEGAGFEGAADLVVVGDGEHVQTFAPGGFEQFRRVDSAIAGPVSVAVELDANSGQGESERAAPGVSPTHISPPSKYSFFQIGTVCLRVSMA